MDKKLIIKGVALWVLHLIFTLIVMQETVEVIAKPIPGFIYVLAMLVMMSAFMFFVYHTVRAFNYIQNNLK